MKTQDIRDIVESEVSPMVMRMLFGFKFWQILIAVIATIVAGGWALVKFFEAVDKRLEMAKEHN